MLDLLEEAKRLSQRRPLETGQQFADLESARELLLELVARVEQAEAKKGRLEETVDRVRYFLQEDDPLSAWRSVRTFKEALAETQCPACRAHLSALAAQPHESTDA